MKIKKIAGVHNEYLDATKTNSIQPRPRYITADHNKKVVILKMILP